MAIDLETTGLSASRDAIIEIGAVRFDRERTIDEFHTLVNPGRELPQFIRDLTGITQEQVDSAPSFPMVADRLRRFMSGATPVAHNASFDLGFLRQNGVDAGSRFCDTFELAYLVRPAARGYSLPQLAKQLSVNPGRSHRALDDARTARDVFLALLGELAQLDPSLLAGFRRLSRESGWNIAALLDSVEDNADLQLTSPATTAIGGVDSRELRDRLSRPPPLQPRDDEQYIDPAMIAEALSQGSQFSYSVTNFEERDEQIEMSAAIADIINRGGRLMVEAGTGVGKSLAYLLPAALYALKNGRRIVVSTNTINLQEQLVNKDLPMVKEALSTIAPTGADAFRYTSLKGRANYLCFKRWNVARRSSDLDESRARMIAKTTDWLTRTETGDRADLNLGPSGFASAWNPLSAQRAFECPARAGGPCFLQAARSDAEAAHVVVVNHSLLISNLVSNGSAIPDYDVLIIDEAHHLEDVATNTINLQEQLVNKDLPMVKEALSTIAPTGADAFRYTSLKGRANYLCFKRWNVARRSSDLDESRARMIAKTTDWLTRTETGDRADLNLGPSGFASAWNPLSAQRAFECPARAGGPCFLQAARSDAEAAHVVVVNHSLLISNLVSNGSAIPDYDVLIIDEAHHLEDVATDQLTYTFSQSDIDDIFSDLTTERGLLVRAQNALADTDRDEGDRDAANISILQAQAASPRLRDEMRDLLRLVGSVMMLAQGRSQTQYDNQVRILESHRNTPEWAPVVQIWDNIAILLSELSTSLSETVESIRRNVPEHDVAKDALLSDLVHVQIGLARFSDNVGEMINESSESGIYWVNFRRQSSDVTLNSAPLEVGFDLQEKLYDQKRAIVMTSATMSTEGSLDHAAERLGFDKARHLVLGSPFNYSEAALLYAPSRLPHPNSPHFQQAVETVVLEAASAAQGSTMALFTSHGALRNTARAIRQDLESQDIQVLSQGVDGPPQLLAESFLEEPRSVLLGTSSFWQGVDFAGDSLTVLIIARLPFTVPSDPIFQARSEQYGDEAFTKYAVPQAILKFRQGFGRLIRSSTDRGVAIVLDSRLTNSRYGRRFISSLPEMTVTDGRGQGTPAVVRRWLEYTG